MTFVVTDNCKGCRFTDCVAVCPVDCFHGDDEMLYIDPNECIDCGACVPECPVEAIYDEAQLPEDQNNWLAINTEKAPNLAGDQSKGGAVAGRRRAQSKARLLTRVSWGGRLLRRSNAARVRDCTCAR